MSRQSEKSNSLDREENIQRGQLSAKKVAVYSYDPSTDKLHPGTGGFSGNADITTTISGGTITQTDGDRTYTVTISGGTITEVWT